MLYEVITNMGDCCQASGKRILDELDQGGVVKIHGVSCLL